MRMIISARTMMIVIGRRRRNMEVTILGVETMARTMTLPVTALTEWSRLVQVRFGDSEMGRVL
jgi:hypothetical protein